MPMYMVKVCMIGVLLACRDGKMFCSILLQLQFACFETYRLCQCQDTQSVDGSEEDKENDKAEHQVWQSFGFAHLLDYFIIKK